MKDTRYTGHAIRPEVLPMSLYLARLHFPHLPNDWHGVIKHRELYYTVAHHKNANAEAWQVFVINFHQGNASRRQSLDAWKWTKAEAEAYVQQLKTKYNP